MNIYAKILNTYGQTELKIEYMLIIGCLEEKAMAPHSSTLAWKIPRMEEPGGVQSTG